MNLRRLGMAGLGAGLLATLVAAPVAAGVNGTGVRGGQVADRHGAVEGTWRTEGYATTMVIENGRATLYETTGISCVAGMVAMRVGRVSDDGTVRFAGAETAFTVRPARGGRTLVQHFDGAAGDRYLSRLAALPDRCTRPVTTGPLATFDVFWQTYAENYPFFAAKGVDWQAVRDRYRPLVRPDTTDAQLFDMFVKMIEPLGDAHTRLRIGDREYSGVRPGTALPSVALEARVRPFIERRDLRGPLQNFGNDRIGYADLPGRIGYLRVVTFTEYTEPNRYQENLKVLDQALDQILTRERTSGPARLRGLIIDLRVNGGGDDALGLRLAERLTDRAYLAYRKQARNDPAHPDRFTDPQPIWVRPADQPRYTGPIAVLTGGSTVSAGEGFTQSLFERSPRPVRIGGHTQGVFSDVLIRQLPNGGLFLLPNERYLTRDGRTFDGDGIPPDIRTPVFTDAEFAADRDSAFDRAVAVLSG